MFRPTTRISIAPSGAGRYDGLTRCGESFAANYRKGTVMLATVGTKPALHQRVKLMIVAALLALSLMLGIATSAQRVDAKTVCYRDPGLGLVCTVVK